MSNALVGAAITFIFALTVLLSSLLTEKHILNTCANHGAYVTQERAIICKPVVPQKAQQQNT